MECVIYKGTKKNDTYLFVAGKGDYGAVPQQLLENLGELKFVMSLLLDKNRKLAQADVGQVMFLLKKQGYYLQIPPHVNIHSIFNAIKI
ncbi:MAG: YcgL domain-containing protein [Gammaproteobacteria bacterium]|nr:YcgL domain-containing protein [Gammaproteobacteria bacterium]